jgi:hypothetical protein
MTTTKQVVVMTTQELENFIGELYVTNFPKGNPFFNMKTTTKVRMNKTGNPYYDQVSKISSRNFHHLPDYEKSVRNKYIKEGLNPDDFKVETPKGKEHISPCLLKDTKTGDKRYFMVRPYENVKPTLEYQFNGDSIGKEVFEQFLVKVSENKKQQTDDKVECLTYDLMNIDELNIDGMTIVHQR